MPQQHHHLYAWKTGAALALAVAAGYVILTMLFAFWPESGIGFQNAITTGAHFDVRGINTSWSLSAFLYALALLLVLGFTIGASFAWIHKFLHRSDQ